MSNANTEKSVKMGRPNIQEDAQLKPRFTLNISDRDYSRFVDAVKKSKKKRSEFARTAILVAVDKELSEK